MWKWPKYNTVKTFKTETKRDSNFHWPGIDTIFAAEGIFDWQSTIVQLQGREAALVQTDHLSMRQCVAVGIVACMWWDIETLRDHKMQFGPKPDTSHWNATNSVLVKMIKDDQLNFISIVTLDILLIISNFSTNSRLEYYYIIVDC